MLNQLTVKKKIRTFSVSPENLTGGKGEGGKAIEGSASHAAEKLGQGWKVNPYLVLQPGTTTVLADVRGQGAIKHIWLTDNAATGRRLLLRIYFDDCEVPSVCAPLSDFFANTTYEYRQMSSLAMCVNPKRGLNCYFEMPYFKSFRVEIEYVYGEKPCNVFYQIDCEEKAIDPNSLYFHAQFRRVNPLPYKETYTILDGVKGCGQYVGTFMHWGVKSDGWWGEGEIKFFVDGDREFPSICGTGTEDYFCGAYNFDVNGEYKEFSTPYSGLYKVGATDALYRAQRYFDMYRWHITDPIYFEKDLKVTIQALGWRQDRRYRALQDDLSSVAYFYADTPEAGYLPLPDYETLELP